ncbi:hypothetical protein [Cellvibrio sp. UBA7661]|jgi:hypothetical protein|uniref:hypothetical protein n=1 Tax=Cellvibrio sp. UBA7661 TaxID=1946311 RepID=UPI002F3543CB
MKKIIALRWLALVPTIYATWYVVLVAGFFIYRLIEKSICPKNEIGSAGCQNPAVVNILDFTIHGFVALSAIAVLSTAIFVAPSYKKQISYLVFLVGSIIAIYMGSQLQSWSLVVVAIVSGALLLLVNSKLGYKKPNKA